MEKSQIEDIISECNPEKPGNLNYAEFEKLISSMVDKE